LAFPVEKEYTDVDNATELQRRMITRHENKSVADADDSENFLTKPLHDVNYLDKLFGEISGHVSFLLDIFFLLHALTEFLLGS